MMYLIVSKEDGETWLDEINDNVFSSFFTKVENKEYIATYEDLMLVYDLTSDYAIKELGRKILNIDHPKIDYIRKRYDFLEALDDYIRESVMLRVDKFCYTNRMRKALEKAYNFEDFIQNSENVGAKHD